ncbi:MAG: glycine oxidase ThiO [Gemmataceae bacterium]
MPQGRPNGSRGSWHDILRLTANITMDMAASVDVLVIGGGVIGLTSAYYLARAGAKVAVCDRGQFGRESSWAGAGIIPPGNPARATAPLDRLRALSAAAFPKLSEELNEATGIDNGYRRCGGLALFGNEDDAPPLDAWNSEGINWELCDAAQLWRYEPRLSPGVGRAFHLPDMAQLRNPWHMRALTAALNRLGVGFHTEDRLVGLVRDGDRIDRANMSWGPIQAETYLCCLGAWTGDLFTALGLQCGIRPIRGQILLMRTQEPILRRIVEEGKRYLVPREDGRLLVGSTEEDVGFDSSTTDVALAALHRFAVNLVPDLAKAQIERSWAGLRPGNLDGLPTLGRMPGYRNLWIAAGHFRAGIQLSPATGWVMAQAIRGEPTDVALDSFRADREPSTPTRPAFQS